MPVIQGSTNFNISGNATLTEIHGNATLIQFHRLFTEEEREQISDYIATFVALPDINEKLEKHSLTQAIVNLPRSQAAYSDYEIKKKSGPCCKGTREALLRELADWVTGSFESRMYILSGLAGIGKSTIAYTIAARADDLGLLGASFFFSRDEADRKNAKKFFSTIAYQLCGYNEAFCHAIGTALLTKRGSAATMKDPQEQLEALIVEPLRSVVLSCLRPILVVVDALDECDECDGRAVLTGLSQLVRDLPSFRIILTTRPKSYLTRRFSRQDGRKLFHLQDIEEQVVNGDIRLYLEYSLSQEQVQARLDDPDEEWHARDTDIEALVQAAGKLFIIASIAVLFILDRVASNPEGQMAKLLYAFTQDRTPFKGLNHFYAVILRNALPEDCDNDIIDRYQSVVGTIITIQNHLPVGALARLIGKRDKEMHAVLRGLQSVILLGSDDIPLIYHKSFPDYITEPTRCKDGDLRIDPRIHHTRIAIHCFRIMNGDLRHNILNLGVPARFLDNAEALTHQGLSDDQLQEEVPLELQYACVYWANHLEDANVEDADLMKGLEMFTNEHLLHWFETLSLIEKLDWAPRSLGIALRFLKSKSLEVHQLLSDGIRFITKFYETIKRSAYHTYCSALPFTPSESLLYRRYKKEASQYICQVQVWTDNWDALIAMPRHGKRFNQVAFSRDSTMFASWNEVHCANTEEILNIWDASTGTARSRISSESNYAKFAIADDLSTIGSYRDNIITLHNVDGITRGITLTTSTRIRKLALSSGTGRVAAGLTGRTVCLWDSGKGELLASLDGFVGRGDLRFSYSGSRLAYETVCGCIELRDGITGAFVARLQYQQELHDGFVFSRDGFHITSLTTEKTLTLWNTDDGKLIGAARDAGYGLVVSTNGCLLATMIRENVKLWDGNSGNPLPLVENLVLGSRVISLAFSKDDILAIETSGALMLYGVRSHSFILTRPVPGVQTLAFSPDCTRLAAGDRDGVVHVWHGQIVEAPIPPLKEERSGHFTVLTFAQDCSRLACGVSDGTVELWEPSHTKGPIAAHRAHIDSVTTLEFSPSGRYLASGSSHSRIKLWLGEDGSPTGALPINCTSGTMTMSDYMLAAVVDSNVTIWDLKTRYIIGIIRQPSPYYLEFSNNGVHLAVWNGSYKADLKKVFDVLTHKTITQIKFSTFHEAMGHSSPSLSPSSVRGGIFRDGEQCYLGRHLYPEHGDHFPAIWIPRYPRVLHWVYGSHWSAVAREDRRIIFLQNSGHFDD